jgi:HlyD family secretion protein
MADRILNLQIIGLGAALVALLGGITGLSAAIDVSGAIIASGNLVVESELKKVQHPSGGVVSDILVSEGERVAKDQILVKLDPTVAKATLNAVSHELSELSARKARLEAERDGASEPRFQLATASDAASDATSDIVAGERRLFQFRVDAVRGQKAQLRERVKQLQDEARGLDNQLSAKRVEIDLVGKELEGVRDLWEKKLIPVTRLMSLERDAARLGGDAGKLESALAQTRGKIAETELQILQIDQSARSDVATQLADIRAKMAELTEKRAAAQDQSERIDIRAPQAGLILNQSVHTKGGVISAGEQLMQIVPDSDALTVEARLRPTDIHEVKVGQAATLRFTNFNQRTTPEIEGTVTRVSADAVKDDRVQEPYYVVRLRFARSDALKTLDLLPGMPVEVFIRTESRSMMSYLVKPLRDQVEHAFRER